MSYHHLTKDLRCQIYTLKSTGMIQKDIANYIGVSPSTISRELKRNTGGRSYRYQQANEKSVDRRHKASSQLNKMTDSMVDY